MTDETQTPADEAPAQVPAAETGYVLTRRDRTAIHFIDWAVKIGTAEFQQRYRPVTDELFTHVYIDPTAKPAFVPPALASVEQLDAHSDPLEIIRSHLGVVIDDRQARDKARLELQAHFEESERNLADERARATDLETRLADTTARLQSAEARVAELGAQLESEVSGLHTNHAAELAAALAAHEATVAELIAERDRTLADLTADREAAVAALEAERNAEIARLEAQLENDTFAQRADHEQQIEALRFEHAGAVDALALTHAESSAEAAARHSGRIAELEAAHAAAVAALQTELAAAIASAEATTVQLKAARLEAGSLTAQRDRAIAEGSEWRNRLQQTVGALATSVDVGEWTDGNAPDARLVSFIEETQLALSTELELARATLDEIEEVATTQLVDEEETSDYAIGANDAAVLVLNSLYGSADDADADGPVAGAVVAGSAGTGAGVAGAGVAGAGVASAAVASAAVAGAGVAGSDTAETDGEALTEVEEADDEFEAELQSQVDIEFEAAPDAGRAAPIADDPIDGSDRVDGGREAPLGGDAAIGHTAVIEHHIVRDDEPEIDDVDQLGSLFADDDEDDDDDAASSGERGARPSEQQRTGREHRRAS